MTDTPDTSPEAVERLANRLGGTPLYDGGGEESDLPDNAADTLRALSTALEAEKVRADAAETELDEAVEVMIPLMNYAEHGVWSELDPVTAGRWLEVRALASGVERPK